MKRLLVVTSAFAPAAQPEVYRTLKFVKYLREFGYEPEVLWVHGHRSRPRDTGLLDDVPDGVKVHRVHSVIGRGVCSGIAKLMGKPWLREDHAFFSKALNKVRKIHSKRPFDAMFLSAPPLRLPQLGVWIHRELGIPWVLDLRDPWGTLTPGDRSNWDPHKTAMIGEMEKDAYEGAGSVVLVLQNMLDDLLGIHPQLKDKACVIHNGYDETEFGDVRYERSEKDGFRLFFGGTLRSGPGIREIAEGISIALKRDAGLREQLRFTITGRRKFAMPGLVQEQGLEANVKLLGPIPNSEYVKELVRSDALFFYMPWKYAASMKLFSYLRSGRPILSVCPGDGPAAKLVNEFSAGSVTEPGDAGEFAEALLGHYRKWRDGGVESRKPTDALGKYERKYLTGLLAGALDKITAAK